MENSNQNHAVAYLPSDNTLSSAPYNHLYEVGDSVQYYGTASTIMTQNADGTYDIDQFNDGNITQNVAENLLQTDIDGNPI
jgi:hypothetical protein